MHWYVDFKDPVPDPDREPTLFEWCGGLPALTRMTRLFYEKHVPEDPLLAPLFATMLSLPFACWACTSPVDVRPKSPSPKLPAILLLTSPLRTSTAAS